MEGALTGFLSIETIVFALVVWFIVLSVRFAVQKLAIRIAPYFPDKYEGYWITSWREWILPAMPIVIGGVLAFLITGYPYPTVFAGTESARVFFGLVAGGIAGYAYRFFKYKLDELLPKKAKEIEDSMQIPPSNNE
jgi:hypothetical protein